MKQLHNIADLYSRQNGLEPMGVGYACILDSEFVDKRCLYNSVS